MNKQKNITLREGYGRGDLRGHQRTEISTMDVVTPCCGKKARRLSENMHWMLEASFRGCEDLGVVMDAVKRELVKCYTIKRTCPACRISYTVRVTDSFLIWEK